MIFSMMFEILFFLISMKINTCIDLYNAKILIVSVMYEHSPQTVNYHSVETMFTLSCWFIVGLLFSVHCLQKQTRYSRLYKEVNNSSLTVLNREGVIFVHCAGLCTGDDYCIEFLYSETSGQCIRHHYVKKGSYSYEYVVQASPRMLYFKKGKLSFIFLSLFKYIMPWN